MICIHFSNRVITIQAVDGDQAAGPSSIILVTFDRNCTVLRDGRGNDLPTLSIPLMYTDYQRLELCTAIGIKRIEIVNSLSITNLQFMRNINVSSQ